MSLYSELKRRNVFRVAIAYLAAAWLITEVAGTLFPAFGIPDWGVRFIVILFTLGFIPALVVSWVYELTPEGIKREKVVVRDASITHITGRRLDVFTIGLIVVALTFVLFDRLWLSPRLQRPATPAAAALTESLQTTAPEKVEPQYPPNSIAVLPFVNMSEDATNEYFSDGISEEILNALAQVKELKVAGRTSSFTFKGKSQDFRTIGDALHVAHILDGSVRKSGNRLRITAQLIKVEDGYHLWSDSYDRELTDVFVIQDEIAAAILEQLKPRLLIEEEMTVAGARTEPEVYDLYLLARKRIYERTQRSLVSAAELLDEAMALDPEFAPVHAQRGIIWLLLSELNLGEIPSNMANTQARLHLDRALQLHPNLAEALAGLGLYYSALQGGNALAIQFLEQALAINPNLIDASNWLHFAYRDAGQWQKSLVILEDMIDRDPLYSPGIGNAIWTYNKMGQQEKSWALLERAKTYMPNDALVGSEAGTHFSLGNFADGLQLAETAVRLLPGNPNQIALSEGLHATHQFARCVEECHDYFKILALWQLGLLEEASMLAYQTADAGISATPLFVFLNANGRHEELIEYLEGRWADLDDFETGFTFGSALPEAVSNIALAYARTGNEQQFDETVAHIRTKLEQMLAEGLNNYIISLDQATYYVLVGDHDKALKHLAISIDAGYIGSTPLVQERPALEPLEGDSRYDVIRTRMIDHLNVERKKLGLELVGN